MSDEVRRPQAVAHKLAIKKIERKLIGSTKFIRVLVLFVEQP